MRHVGGIAALVLGAALLMPALAQDKAPKKETPPAKAPDAKAPDKKADAHGHEGHDHDMSMMQLPKPGKQHETLKQLAGNWKVSGKFRMSPDQPWEESTSQVKSEMLFNGMFLRQSCKGDKPMMEGWPNFEGFGIMGFDQMTNKYTSMWIDNMGSSMMFSEGDADAAGKTLTLKGNYKCPMTGGDTWARQVLKIESADKYTFEMSGPDQAGKEFQQMVWMYERAK